MQDDIDVECEQCDRRRHSFFEDPIGDLSYICEPQPWWRKVLAIARNAKAFDSQFILNRSIFLKRNPEIICNGEKNYQHTNATPAIYRFCVLLAHAFT